jgi:hypothetical protein
LPTTPIEALRVSIEWKLRRRVTEVLLSSTVPSGLKFEAEGRT